MFVGCAQGYGPALWLACPARTVELYTRGTQHNIVGHAHAGGSVRYVVRVRPFRSLPPTARLPITQPLHQQTTAQQLAGLSSQIPRARNRPTNCAPNPPSGGSRYSVATPRPVSLCVLQKAVVGHLCGPQQRLDLLVLCQVARYCAILPTRQRATRRIA